MAEIKENTTGIAQKYKEEFRSNEVYRRDKENEWVDAMRQFKGQYDQTTLGKMDPNASKVYPKYTRSKVISVLSRLNDMLIPDNDRNWEIYPTPFPKVSPEVSQKVIAELGAQSQGQPITEEMAFEAIEDYVEKACDRMRDIMDDQLEELQSRKLYRKMLFSGIMYGTGIIKGPLTQVKSRVKSSYIAGEIVQIPEDYDMPFMDVIPVWRFYPDMAASTLADTDFIYERHPMTRQELRALSLRDDFDGPLIKVYIREHPEGDTSPKPWEQDIQLVTKATTPISKYKRYEVFERWGYTTYEDAVLLGIDLNGIEPGSEILTNVWILGNFIIKAEAADSMPYRDFTYEEDESSIFGRGLPNILSDTQEVFCAATRMLIDNAASVAGPQVEVNFELMEPGQDITEFHARKVWLRRDIGPSNAYPAVRGLEFNSHIPEMIEIINLFRGIGDEESALPSGMMGEVVSTHNETAQAASMRQSSVNLTVKDIVKRFDECNEGFIGALYRWNMVNNPEVESKGDFTVKARGSASLITKEVRMQAMDFFASTLTPEDEPYLKRGNFLRQRAKLHDIEPDELVRTDEEAQKIIASQVDQEAMALAKEQQAAEVDYAKGKTLHMAAKAKLTNIEAKKAALTRVEQPGETDEIKARAEMERTAADLEAKRLAMAQKQNEHGMDLFRKSNEHAMNMRHQEEAHKLKLRTAADLGKAKVTQMKKAASFKKKEVKKSGK